MPQNATSFQPGNQAALTHGARSRIALEKRAGRVREELTALVGEHCPHLTPADAPLVDLAVDLTTKLRLLSEFYDKTSGGSLIDLRGKPRPAAQLYLQLHRQALATFDRLGIGPSARASIIGALGLPSHRERLAEQAQRELREKYR